MSSSRHISSTDNARIKAAVKLREGKHRRKSGLFIAEGVREIERALAADFTLCALFICPERFNDAPPGGVAVQSRTYTVDEPVFRKMAYRERPEGVLAVFEHKPCGVDQIERAIGAAARPLVLVACGVAKPGNLGAMARTADAAGCCALLAVDAVIDLFNPNAIRASTGAVFTLPIAALSTAEALAVIKQAGLAIIAADPAGTTPHTQVDLSQPAAIAIGAEDAGLAEPWRSAADHVVAIANRGGTADSLNASVAAGVLLFEAVRQREAID